MDKLLKNRYRITRIQKRTTAKFWENVEIGDEIEVSYNISRADSYSPVLTVVNIAKGTNSTMYVSKFKDIKNNIEMESIYDNQDLSIELQVQSVIQKTTAKFFKNLKPGDTFKIRYSLNGGHGYAPNVEIYQNGQKELYTNAVSVATRLLKFDLKEVLPSA